jgi:hypothetical protein
MYTGMEQHTTLVSALYQYQTGMNLRLHQPNIRFIPTLYQAKISLEPNTSPIPDNMKVLILIQYQYLMGYERGHTSTTLV